jgi:hypothetical protein
VTTSTAFFINGLKSAASGAQMLIGAFAQRIGQAATGIKTKRFRLSAKPSVVDQVKIGAYFGFATGHATEPASCMTVNALNEWEKQLAWLSLNVAVRTKFDLLRIRSHLGYHSAQFAHP